MTSAHRVIWPPSNDALQKSRWLGRSTAGPFHSDVPSQARSARFAISTRTHREVLAPMDRAEEKAGPKDVGEQALMRGLDTAFPFFRLGLSLV